MAVPSNSFFRLLIIFSFLYWVPVIRPLSTVSISESSNQTLTCVLNQNSYLRCTSFPHESIRIPMNSANRNLAFSGVVSGNGFVCALRSPLNSNTSLIFCWRFSGNSTSYKRIYKGPELREFKSGDSHICGLQRESRRLLCWQWPEFDPSRNFQNFSSIALGQNFVCGLTTGKIVCQGNGASSVPNGNFSVIAARFRHACAITLDNDLACWGETNRVVPQGKFSALALGENRSCALRSSNGTVVCWGSNNFRLPELLENTQFLSIEAGKEVFCGVVASNYSLQCWGNDVFVFNSSGSSETVLPGPCRRDSECSSGQLTGSSTFCGRGFIICGYCKIPPASLEPSPSEQNSHTRTWTRKHIAFLVVGCIGSFTFLLTIAFFVFKYCKNRCRIHDSGRLDEARTPEEPKQLEKRLSKLASLGNPCQLKEISLEELLQATDGFSPEHKIGTGSFGVVYRGVLSNPECHVAIKRAEINQNNHLFPASYTRKQQQHKTDTDSAFVNELESLSRLNHKNLVKLIGFYEDNEERVLVYEYIDNGSLNDHLHNPQYSPLSWLTRIKIALDAAHGIQYLHELVVPSIIHRDIKSSNILLDSTWTAKVSDFGLSLMGPTDEDSHISLHAAGTFGYIDPEYFRLQQLTIKSDVYSFGVVILELLSGQKAIHKNQDGNPRSLVDYVVPYIVQDDIHKVLDGRVQPPTACELEAVACVGCLAVDCVNLEARERPSMAEVVGVLERALAALSVLQEPSSQSTSDSSLQPAMP